MKKLLNVLAITLAVNFIAMAAGVYYLYSTGALSREKLAVIKLVMYPATTQGAVTTGDDVAADKKEGSGAATQPTIKLDELLARVASRSAGEPGEVVPP